VSATDDFDSWVETLAIDLGTTRSGTTSDRFLATWLRRLYDQHGPVAFDRVEEAFVADQVQLTTRNVAVVLTDIERTTDLRPGIVVDRYHNGVRVAVDGSFTTPSVTEWANPEALADLAGYLQEHVAEALWRAWPVCPEHDMGLWPEVHGDAAVWWCRYRGHPAAPVGQLRTEGTAGTAASFTAR
jgi:hypothetical protein